MLWKMLRLLLILLCAFPGPGFGKVCTNTGVSHTLRSRYLATFESDVGRSFITKYPSSSGSDSEAQFGNLEEPDGGSRRIMLQRQNSSFLEGASLHNVRLSPDSLHGRAQQTNLEYLLMLDVDNLVYSFRTNAGLNASGSAYGGWESPDSELRGHFVGHYLSATALMWASTHNATIFKKMNAVVKALAACQQRFGTGYLSAFPTSLFDRFESLQPVWAPYYTIHKIMAGLLDQYTLAKNKLAFKMVLGMAQYFSGRVDAVIKSYTIEKHWQSLNEETGGMNDVMYRLYQITGNEEHLQLAHLFDKPCFLGLLAVQADSISGFHANTHIPVVIGAQMRYEATGDELYKELTQYFLKIVSSSHTYATGGTSVGEFWSDPNRLGSTLDSENEESCTTYNMLKVARNLFRWTKEMHYADFYERALLNGVLSIQRGQEPGVMIYMLPLRAGSSKAKTYHGWGTPYDSFWCCYGTATESFSKLGDSIFFEEKGQIPHLYVIQFVSSLISWNAAGLLVNQAVQQITSFNPTLNVTFNFTQLQNNQLGEATFFVRVPNWAASTGCESSLNGVKLEAPTPGAFFAITRQWKTGDTVSFSFLATVRLERIQDDEPQYSSLYAIYFGPYLLAGMSDDGDFKLGPVNVSSPSDWIVPVSGNLFTFAQYRSSRTAQALISTKDGSLSMANMPLQGSEEAPQATFRVRTTCEQEPEFNGVTDLSSWLIHKEISLELMDQPGKYVAHSGIEQSVTLLSHDNASLSKVSSLSSAFRVRPGLSGEPNSVSFEASEMPGCFLSTQSSGDVLLECKQNGCKHFEAAASFSVLSGVTTYHPMSFSAHGSNRTFLLFPLNAYKDEKYTVYFEVE